MSASLDNIFGTSAAPSTAKAPAAPSASLDNIFGTSSPKTTTPSSSALPITKITAPTIDNGPVNASKSNLSYVDPNKGDNSTGGIIKNTIEGLPKALWDLLPYKKVYQGTQDYLNDSDATPINVHDTVSGAIKGIEETVGPAVSTLTGIFMGPKTYKLPGGGTVSNLQKDISDVAGRIFDEGFNGVSAKEGTNPYEVVAKTVPEAIFDGLLIIGLMDKVFSPRESIVAEGVKTNDLPASSQGSSVRDFRITDPIKATVSKPLPKNALDALQKQGAEFSKNYDPKLPTYWRTTPRGNGVIRGEVVQLKPSYFDMFKSKFGGDISNVPPEGENVIYQKSTTIEDIQKNIENKSPVVKTSSPAEAQEIFNKVVPIDQPNLDNIFARGNLKGMNPDQPTMLTPEEAQPHAEQIAEIHTNEVHAPALAKGGPTVIGADDLKDHFGKDYNDNNHPAYSRAAFLQYEKALKTNPDPTVIFTGGGPASGKTELVTKNLINKGFKGIIYDSNMANYNGIKKQIEMAREAGKKIEIHGVLPNLENARTFSIQRENKIGRGISDHTFARGHVGFPNTLQKLLEEGIIKPAEVYLMDARNTEDLLTTTKKIFNNEYETNPLATLKKLGYTEENVRKQYSTKNFNSISGKRESGLRERSKLGNSSSSNRTNKGENADNGGNESVLGTTEKGEKSKTNNESIGEKTQKEKIKEAINNNPKSIREIAAKTKILEPNVRRILGVGAKEGTFERVDKGVYVLSKNGQDTAWIETGNATEALPRLAKEGFKADMVFLDIPYDTPAVKGGNRGVNYKLLSVADFSKVLDATIKIARTANSPIIHMYSQAPSGMKAMQKYNDLFIEKGLIPVGKGQYQKTFADGSPVTSPNGKISKPEGILVFTKSGTLDKDLKNLNFTLKRPKGYQTEKPAEMLKAMIQMTTNEGDTVLDPFAGSGVTGAEAVRAGRKAYLIEKDENVSKNITQPRVKEAVDSKETNALTKAIESTPESKRILETNKVTGFEYNPESGFVNIKPLEEGIDNVKDFIKETNKGLNAARNLDDSLYNITKANEADKIQAVKLAKKVDISPKDAEAIYHYEENKTLELTERQKEIYEESIRPLADASARIASKLKETIPIDSESYTPRFVSGRGNVVDRIKAGMKGIGGRGTVLGKNAPSLKHRTMKAITDESGNRFVVSVKDGVVTKLQKGKGGIIIRNSYNPRDGVIEETKRIGTDKNGKGIWRATGKKYTIGEATTKEIERETNLIYHKNVFVNRLVTYLNLRQVERANDFLEAYKNSKEFESIGMKFGEGMAPKNWTTSINPSFRGYMLDPRVADVMDKYASSMMKGKDPLRALTSVNRFLRTTIFFNPLIHIPNIGTHWLVNRGATKLINPIAYKRLATTSARAINAVIHQNQDYIDMLNAGAPLMYSSESTRNMHNLLLGKMTEEVDKNPKLDFLKKALKSINPYVLSGKATWMVNDIAVMQAIYEEMVNNPNVTMEQAIADVGSHIPNYRLPAGKIVDLLSNPNITMFGAYHFGALKSYYEMAKTLITGNTEGKNNETFGDKTNARGDVLSKLLMLGIIALVIYPAIDRALQKATGNPNAKIRRAGPVTFPYNVNQVVSGAEDVSQFIQSVITPAVGTKELISQAFNLDLFTGEHIRDNTVSGNEQVKESFYHAENTIAPVAQYQKMNSGKQSTEQFLESLAGISNPDQAQSKLANAVISAQTKVDKLDKDAVARVTTSFDQIKKLGYGTPEANAIYDELSSADKLIYKDLKAVDIAKQSLDAIDKIEPIVRQAHALGFGSAEANTLVGKLSTEDQATYKMIKSVLYPSKSDTTVLAPEDPSKNVSTSLDTYNQQSIITHISNLAKGIGTDPVTFFKDVFAGNGSYRLMGTKNGQIIVARAPDATTQDIKKAQGGNTKEYKLDHTVPLEIGGNNGDDNLQLMTTAEWAQNTSTEDYLGQALEDGNITGSQAREYIIRFKKGLGETMSPALEKEYADKYGSRPLTLDEIKDLVDNQ